MRWNLAAIRSNRANIQLIELIFRWSTERCFWASVKRCEVTCLSKKHRVLLAVSGSDYFGSDFKRAFIAEAYFKTTIYPLRKKRNRYLRRSSVYSSCYLARPGVPLYRTSLVSVNILLTDLRKLIDLTTPQDLSGNNGSVNWWAASKGTQKRNRQDNRFLTTVCLLKTLRSCLRYSHADIYYDFSWKDILLFGEYLCDKGPLRDR